MPSFYIPLTPFDMDQEKLPLKFTPKLILRHASPEEIAISKKHFGEIFRLRPLIQSAKSSQAESFAFGGQYLGRDRHFHAVFENMERHDNDVWKLKIALLLLYEEIAISGHHRLGEDGELISRSFHPIEGIYRQVSRELIQARRNNKLRYVNLGPEQINFLKRCLDYSKGDLQKSNYINMYRELQYIPSNKPTYFLSLMAIIDGILCHEDDFRKAEVIARRMEYYYDDVAGTLELTKYEPPPTASMIHKDSTLREIWKGLYNLRNCYAHGSTPDFGKGKLEHFRSLFHAGIFLNHGIKSLLRWSLESPREFELFRK